MDVTERFSDRVEDYDRYRPRYPAALAAWLAARGMTAAHVVADIGAGTGILAELLLGLGCQVKLVDPNRPMLDRAIERLAGDPRASFHQGRAEATGLGDRSVDWVTAGQAFHWFEPVAARREFTRILRPAGRVVLVWNDQKREPGFMADYEVLVSTWARDSRGIRSGHPRTPGHQGLGEAVAGGIPSGSPRTPGNPAVGQTFAWTSLRLRPIEEELQAFFEGPFERAVFDNEQRLDEEGLIGRYSSSSYMPGRSDPNHEASRQAALELFARHQQGGFVTMRYHTRVFLGRVSWPDL